MVEVTKGTEEVLGGAHLIADDDAPFPAALDFVELENGAVALKHIPHDILIEIEGVFGGLVEEDLVADVADVDLGVGAVDVGKIGGEGAARDEVATELLGVCGGGDGGGAVGLETEGLFGGGRIEEEVVDPGVKENESKEKRNGEKEGQTSFHSVHLGHSWLKRPDGWYE